MSGAPLVIVGPTGAGKTAAALRIAERHGVDIVSMDAMQVYRGMDVGTAKATPHERARVRHHCVDVRDPTEPFDAVDFAAEVERVGTRTVLCGGTVFYLRAWMQPLVDLPPVDPEVRARCEAVVDPHAALVAVDPVLAARLHPNDRVRVIRGLEVHAQTGRRLSELHDADLGHRKACTVVWLDRDDLDDILDARVDAMMRAGYLDEVGALLDAGVPRTCKPMLSLGYKHLADHLAGEIDLAEAVLRTKVATRQFARRQRKFLRNLGFTPTSDGPHVNAAAAGAFGA